MAKNPNAHVVNDICSKILTVSDKEVAQLREIFEGQEQYYSPFKNSLNVKQRKLGAYNNQVLDKILELKELIKKGKDLK